MSTIQQVIEKIKELVLLTGEDVEDKEILIILALLAEVEKEHRDEIFKLNDQCVKIRTGLEKQVKEKDELLKIADGIIGNQQLKISQDGQQIASLIAKNESRLRNIQLRAEHNEKLQAEIERLKNKLDGTK